jgi:hypothetical protein
VDFSFKSVTLTVSRKCCFAIRLELFFPVADELIADAQLPPGLRERVALLGNEPDRMNLELTSERPVLPQSDLEKRSVWVSITPTEVFYGEAASSF